LKKILFLLIIFVFLLFNQQAFAAGYLSALGIMPHGGYTIASNKCKICHAIHGTEPGSYHLLPKKISSLDWEGCEQCHSEASSFSAPVVYSIPGAKGEHSIDGSAWLIPDSTKSLGLIGYSPGLQPSKGTSTRYSSRVKHWRAGKPVASLRCLHCHSPHGNNVMGGPNILRRDPARDGGKAQTLSQFCGDCHNKNYVTYYNGSSHPLADPSSRKIAWGSAKACTGCHRSARSSNGGQFPHQSVGVKLLKAQYNGINMDTVCLDCHRSLDGLEGVGLSF
jgi:hypothetical protein